MNKVLVMFATAMIIAAPVFAVTNTIREDRREMIKDVRASDSAKANLKKIRDEKKRMIVERLDTRFNEVNAKRTSQMAKHLDKMTKILGRDIPEIQAARDANTAQAAKTYTITITTEKNLKMDVGKVRSQLEADLKAVHQLVVAAREAVRAVIK